MALQANEEAIASLALILSKENFSSAPLDVLLTWERQWLQAVYYRPPYAFWHKQISHTLRQQLRESCSNNRIDQQSSFAEKVTELGLSMRFEEPCPSEVDALISESSDRNLYSLTQSLIQEYGNILHALAKFPALERFCRLLLDKEDLMEPNKRLLCDWLIMARYRQLLRLFEQNKLDFPELTEFASLCNKCSEIVGPQTKNGIAYRALSVNLSGDLKEALKLMDEGRSKPGVLLDQMGQMDNVRPLASLYDKASIVCENVQAQSKHHFRHLQRKEGVTLLLATDELYFERYIEKLFESFAFWNADGMVHIHCINFDPTVDRLNQMEQQFGVSINYSIDTCPLIQSIPSLETGYYAGSRYINLPIYLQHYDRIVVADVDGLIRCGLSSVWRENSNSIVMTSKLLQPDWTSARALWEAIAAGSFAITNTPENIRFSWRCANYLVDMYRYCEKTGLEFFYTDQIALVLAFLKSEDCVFEPMYGLYSQGGDLNYTKTEMAKMRFQSEEDYKIPRKTRADRIKN